MNWTQFIYTSGANPYIAKTDKEKNRMLKKYKNKVIQVGESTYVVDDKTRTTEW